MNFATLLIRSARTVPAFTSVSPLIQSPSLRRFALTTLRPAAARSPSLRRARLNTNMSATELVSPSEAHARASTWKLVDCRTEAEFCEGHPEGSVNVPFMHSSAAGMQPNPAFVDEVLAAAGAKDAKILVSCQSGGRSAMACATLAQCGFSTLADVDGGYSAWARDESLPVAK